MPSMSSGESALPEANDLASFRGERWGKRDRWAWLVGVGVPVNLAILAVELILFFGRVAPPRDLPWTLAALLSPVVAIVVDAAFWMGRPWARFGLFGSLILGFASAPTVAMSVVGLPIAVWIFRDTRSKLFFRRPVSDEELRRSWRAYHANRVARTGWILSLAGIAVWPLGGLALICSGIGLSRSNSSERRPVGRRRQATAGLVLGGIEIFACIALVAWVLHSGIPLGGLPNG